MLTLAVVSILILLWIVLERHNAAPQVTNMLEIVEIEDDDTKTIRQKVKARPFNR